MYSVCVSSSSVSKKQNCLKRRWQISQKLADIYWKSWAEEYLPTLSRRTKWNQTSRLIQIGDVVIAVDEGNWWPKGMVVRQFPGKDEMTRAVDFKTSTGTYRRLAMKLYVLDEPTNQGGVFDVI